MKIPEDFTKIVHTACVPAKLDKNLTELVICMCIRKDRQYRAKLKHPSGQNFIQLAGEETLSYTSQQLLGDQDETNHICHYITHIF